MPASRGGQEITVPTPPPILAQNTPMLRLPSLVPLAVLTLWAATTVSGAAIDWEQAYGAVPGDKSAGARNTAALNTALASLARGDTLLVANKTFWVAGGVRATDLHSVTIQLDGTLRFLPGRRGWPTQPRSRCDPIPLQPKTNATEC